MTFGALTVAELLDRCYGLDPDQPFPLTATEFVEVGEMHRDLMGGSRWRPPFLVLGRPIEIVDWTAFSHG